MARKRLLDRLSLARSTRRSNDDEQRYDNVQVISMADGAVIKGHDAVKAHFQAEQELLAAHGANVIFQVQRINLQANTIDELLGEQLAEITVAGDFISATDSVRAVKAKLRPLLAGRVEEGASAGFFDDACDRFTLFLSSYPMQDDKLFYADHFILLPAWVQVHLHAGEFAEVVDLAAALRQQGQPGRRLQVGSNHQLSVPTMAMQKGR